MSRWNYVTENNVQLPDEYDTIFHDLEPFWGIHPRDLLRLREEMESRKDSYTLARTNGTRIDVVNYALHDDRLIRNSGSVLKLFRDIEEFLPPLRAVFSPHDAPSLLSDYGVKGAALRAAQSAICTFSSRLWMFPSLMSDFRYRTRQPSEGQWFRLGCCLSTFIPSTTCVHQSRRAAAPTLQEDVHPRPQVVNGSLLAPRAFLPPRPVPFAWARTRSAARNGPVIFLLFNDGAS